MPPDVFSPRNVEILTWIVAGKSDREIGTIMNLHPKTVNYHVEKMKNACHATTRLLLVVACIHAGLL